MRWTDFSRLKHKDNILIHHYLTIWHKTLVYKHVKLLAQWVEWHTILVRNALFTNVGLHFFWVNGWKSIAEAKWDVNVDSRLSGLNMLKKPLNIHKDSSGFRWRSRLHSTPAQFRNAYFSTQTLSTDRRIRRITGTFHS